VGDLKVTRFYPDELEDDFNQTAWTLQGRLGALELLYTGAYLDRDVEQSIDYTGYNNAGAFIEYYTCTYTNPDYIVNYGIDPKFITEVRECRTPVKGFRGKQDHSRMTHEIRFTTPQDNDLRLVAGVFYDDVKIETLDNYWYTAVPEPGFAPNAPIAAARSINPATRPEGVAFFNDITRTEEQIAVFGELTYDLTDNLSATLGLRWYELETDYYGSSNRRVIDRSPDSPGIHLACGHALKTIGSRAEAEEAYRSACRIKPDFGDAWWSLANLKTYRFSDAELACMEAQETAPGTSLYDRFHLCFALGRAREQRAEHAQAFHWYEKGNRLKQTQTRYSADRFSAECDAQRVHCSSELFERRVGEGCAAADPIFIVGLPRAGSTLLEQILSSHSMVDGTFELPNVLALAHRLGGRRRMDQPSRYPAVLAELDAAELRQLGERYIEETRIYRQGAPMFTDKMPNNFRHIWLIHLILPNATIIDARRHPMACCFSAFKQLFAEGQEFTYGLDSVGRYYRDYVELMDHWDRVLPGRILRVQYEELVSDFEAQVRRLLDHCGLPFEENCLAFHRTERSVRTASSEQVRRPLYDNALTEWRHFAPHLDPLRHALGPVLERYPT